VRAVAPPAATANARIVLNTGFDVVYFFHCPGEPGAIYLGHTTDFPRRRRVHENTGRELLALLPGSSDFEERLHRYFRSRGAEVRPSQYGGEEIVSYVEALVSRGVAAVNPDDLPHLPSVPWPAIDPDTIGALRDTGGQMAMFRPPPRERIKRAASVAYHLSESDEWYTPAHVIEAAREALGAIDLDPASCPRANATVRATHYFSQRVDGLAHEWHGRVWMNPPYSDAAQGFVSHLFHEIDAGRVSAAVALLNQNSMSSQWFGPVYSRAQCLLITEGRLKFEPGDPGQAFSSPSTGSVICYFGPDVARFVRAFRGIGHALVPVAPQAATREGA
jgi:phage N-6-adenine-methyltransferase